jgi:hypothetical protein
MTRILQRSDDAARLVERRAATGHKPPPSVAWASAAGNQAVQRLAKSVTPHVASSGWVLQRKWAYGYTVEGDHPVVKWVTGSAAEPQEAPTPPPGWSTVQATDQIERWYMEMPRRDAATRSVYDQRQELGTEGSAQRMAVVLVVDDAYIGGHSYVAFEWFEQVPRRHEIVRRHKVFHLEGKERRNTRWEQAKRAIGFGSAAGQLAQITPRDATMSVTELDSDPQYFHQRVTRSHYQPWYVKYSQGADACRYALSRVGAVPFSLVPMYPTTYNCAQMAAEIAARAGVPACRRLIMSVRYSPPGRSGRGRTPSRWGWAGSRPGRQRRPGARAGSDAWTGTPLGRPLVFARGRLPARKE